MVMRSYICKHGGNIPKPDNAHLLTLAGIHIAGSDVRSNRSRQFITKVGVPYRNSKWLTGVHNKCYIRNQEYIIYVLL